MFSLGFHGVNVHLMLLVVLGCMQIIYTDCVCKIYTNKKLIQGENGK